jgi:hypothetical protein
MLFLIRRSAAIARARDVASGDDDVAGDVEYQPLFGNDRTRPVYAGAIAPGGKADCKPIAVLVIQVERPP